MADNLTLNAGSGGSDLATDDIGGAHYQIVKITYGALDSQTIAASGAGAVSAGVQRTTLASDDPAVALLATIDSDTNTIQSDTTGILADTAAIDTATAAINAKLVTGTVIGDVNLGATDNAVLDSIVTQLTAGAATAVKAEDVANAAADSGVPAMAVRKATPADLSGTDGDYEFLQMDNGRLWTSATIDAALPAGTNAIGKLAANSGVDIGDVDILSIAAGDNNIGNVDIASAIPAGTNAIGKLAANSGVDIGDVDILSIAAGDNNIGNVDIASAIPAGTNAIGKLAANSGVDIGDVDVTSVPGSATSAATAFDSYTQVAINLTTAANQVLVSSAPSKQIWVYGYAMTCGDADGQTISLQDEDDTAITGIMEFAQYGGMAVSPSGNFEMPVFKLATDKDLEIDITGGDVDGWLSYALVSV